MGLEPLFPEEVLKKRLKLWPLLLLAAVLVGIPALYFGASRLSGLLDRLTGGGAYAPVDAGQGSAKVAPTPGASRLFAPAPPQESGPSSLKFVQNRYGDQLMQPAVPARQQAPAGAPSTAAPAAPAGAPNGNIVLPRGVTLERAPAAPPAAKRSWFSLPKLRASGFSAPYDSLPHGGSGGAVEAVAPVQGSTATLYSSGSQAQTAAAAASPPAARPMPPRPRHAAVPHRAYVPARGAAAPDAAPALGGGQTSSGNDEEFDREMPQDGETPTAEQPSGEAPAAQ